MFALWSLGVAHRIDIDRKMSELSCADDDHPLKPVDGSSTSRPGASNEPAGAEGRLDGAKLAMLVVNFINVLCNL